MDILKKIDNYINEGGLGTRTTKVVKYMEDNWDEMLGADAKQWLDHMKGKFNSKDIEKALKYFKIS